jgi:hypothetical protein
MLLIDTMRWGSRKGLLVSGGIVKRKGLAVKSVRDFALSLGDTGDVMLRRAYQRGGYGAGSREQAWRRHDALRALYRAAEGREGVIIDFEDLISAADMPQEHIYNALDELEREGAVKTFNGNCVTLLRQGLEAYERSSITTRPCRPSPSISRAAALGRAGPGLAATAPPDVLRGEIKNTRAG